MIPDSINADHIQQALAEIDNEGIPSNRHSSTYDLVHEGKRYPPKLVLSIANKYANGEELLHHTFKGGRNTPAFNKLESLGFDIVTKSDDANTISEPAQEYQAVQLELIERYKSLIREDQNQKELYKWEAIKDFQARWDIKADDFAGMLKSIDFHNLMYYGSKSFANNVDLYPEEARSMFKGLFDEEIDLQVRIGSFKEQADQLFEEYFPDKNAQQDERTIATYLTFRYPDRYTFYKKSFYATYADLIDVETASVNKRYPHYLSLIDDFISNYISQDQELLDLSRNTLTEDCYIDENLNILAQDILFRVLDGENFPEGSEDDFKRIIAGIKYEAASNYFSLLDEMNEQLDFERGNSRVVFSIRTDQPRLNLIVGQRYCLSYYIPDDHHWRFIHPSENSSAGIGNAFEGRGPEAYYHRATDYSIVKDEIDAIIESSEKELKRSSKSSFVKYNNSSFERAVFDKEYRNKLFNDVFDIENRFTWVPTHKALVEELKNYQNQQEDLIDILEEAGVESSTLIDEDETGRIRLEEIDPFTFFCLIHKYGDERRLKILQIIAEVFEVSIPQDVHGIPTAYAQKAMLFPFKSDGRTNEIEILWDFFEEALNDDINPELFERVLAIKGVGKSKITEALFNVAPHLYLPLNVQSKPYLRKVLDIDPSFNSYEEYNEILNKVRVRTPKPFYQISREAWLWNTGKQDEDEVINKLDAAMEQPLNQILFGPPGTGKTYHTVNYALSIVDPDYYEKHKSDREALVKRFRELLITDWDNPKQGRIAATTFHQSFTYEDFIEGIKPVLASGEEDGEGTGDDEGALDKDTSTKGNQIQYTIEDGIFKRISERARQDSGGAVQATKGKLKWDQEQFNKAEFYKVSLGNVNIPEDEEIYEYCIQNNKIAIGFLNDQDLSGMSGPQIRDISTNNPEIDEHDTQSMSYFIHNLQKGYYVVIPSGNHRFRAIGKVMGEYEYNPDTPIRYNHFRDVEWLVTDLDLPVDLIYDRNFSQKTIYHLRKKDVKREFFTKMKASAADKRSYVLIIDEINRGNIAQIFGELITLIEEDKREGKQEELEVSLPYSKKPFSVPSNLYLIGTMNTADRSVEALDTALRRRFQFQEEPPRPQIIAKEGDSNDGYIDVNGEEISLPDQLSTINRRIEKVLDKDHLIGHSYFMNVEDWRGLTDVFKQNIIPLLEEYFYGDKGKIQLVLGTGFVRQINNTDGKDLFPETEYNDQELFEDRIVWKVTDAWRKDEEQFAHALDALGIQ